MVANNNDPLESGSASKKPVWMTLVVLALSLATWLFFYFESMPLTSSDTAVVVGLWLFLVLLVNWAQSRMRKKKQAG